MDPVNTLFWNLVSWWKNLKTPPLYSCADNKSAYLLRIDDAIVPPLAFNLFTPRRLIRTTTMADYMLVFVLQKILSLLRQKYSAPLPLRWAKKGLWMTDLPFSSSSCCVQFLFQLSVLYTARKLCAHAPSLLLREFQAPPKGTWTTTCWVVYNGSIWTQIFLERCRGRQRGKKS